MTQFVLQEKPTNYDPLLRRHNGRKHLKIKGQGGGGCGNQRVNIVGLAQAGGIRKAMGFSDFFKERNNRKIYIETFFQCNGHSLKKESKRQTLSENILLTFK